MTESSRLNLLNPLRAHQTKNVTQKIYERHVEKFLEEYIEEEFNGFSIVGNIHYVQAKLIRIFIRDTEDLSNQPITGYGN
jgi:hypothetical protein